MLSRRLFVASMVCLATSAAGLTARAADTRQQAPDFTLRDIGGRPHTLSSYRGKVVLVSFWATWCSPCLAELPQLKRLAEEYATKDVVILSVSIDDARTLTQVRNKVRQLGITHPVLLDPDSAAAVGFNPTGSVPFTALLDRTGRIAERHNGFNAGDEVALKAAIDRLLAEKAP